MTLRCPKGPLKQKTPMWSRGVSAPKKATIDIQRNTVLKSQRPFAITWFSSEKQESRLELHSHLLDCTFRNLESCVRKCSSILPSAHLTFQVSCTGKGSTKASSNQIQAGMNITILVSWSLSSSFSRQVSFRLPGNAMKI